MTRPYGKHFISLGIMLLLITPLAVSAQGFVSLTGLPGAAGGGVDVQSLLNGLFRIVIIGAAFAVVIKLIMAGSKYVLSEVVTDKEDGKRDIRNALTGLLLILASVTILYEINPNLANLPTLTALPQIKSPEVSPVGNLGDVALPSERSLLLNTCPNKTIIAVDGGYCCNDASATSYQCSSISQPVNTRVVGDVTVDLDRVYQSDDEILKKLRATKGFISLGIVTEGSLSATPGNSVDQLTPGDRDFNEKSCAKQSPGSELAIIRLVRNSSTNNNSDTFSGLAVCLPRN